MPAFRLCDCTKDMVIDRVLSDSAVEQLGMREKVSAFHALSETRLLSPDQAVVAVVCSNPRREKDGTFQLNLGDLHQCIATLTCSFEPKFAQASVLLILRPTVALSERGMFRLSVNSQQNLLRLGGCRFYGLCGASKANGEPCKMATYQNGKKFCYLHDRSSQTLLGKRPASSSASSSSKPRAPSAPAPAPAPTQGKIQLTQKPTFAAMQDRFSTIFNPLARTNQRLAHVTSTAANPIPVLAAPRVNQSVAAGQPPPPPKPTQPSAAGLKRAALYTIATVTAPAPPPAASTPLPLPLHPNDVLGNALAPDPKRPRVTPATASTVAGRVASLEGDGCIDGDDDLLVARGSSGSAALEGAGMSYHRDGAVHVPAPAEFGLMGSDGVRRPRVTASVPRQGQGQGQVSRGPALVSIQKVPQPWEAPVGMASLAAVDVSKQQHFKLVGGVLVDIGNLTKQGSKGKANGPTKAKPSAAAAAALAASKVKMNAEIEGLLNRKSKHAAEAEGQWFDDYSAKLDKMAKKEAAVDFVDRQHTLPVKAFFCTSCQTHTEHLPSLCRSQGHTLVPGQTLKRFFACKHCQNKAYTLGQHSGILPRHMCKCGQFAWVATGFLGAHTTGEISELTGDKLVLAASNYNNRHAGEDAFNTREALLKP